MCIPPELYDRSLHELHETHLGTEKNATQSQSHDVLAQDECGHNRVCQMLQDMHPEQGNSAHATNDTKRCARYPLSRPCC